MRIVRVLLVLIACLANSSPLIAEEAFRDTVLPFVQKFCLECHNSEKTRGELDLSRYSKASQVTTDFRRWNHVIEFIRDGEMPPEESAQPSLAQREAVVAALKSLLLAEAKKNSGDPGVVLPRRLSNAEYDRSIQDLIGVDVWPTRDFPADPAAGEGFNNTGEALAMSPNLLQKYLAAAEDVSSRLVLKTEGVDFAPFPVTSYNERKKLTEQAIIDFYQSHQVQLHDYVDAAWRYRYRARDERTQTPQEWAAARSLSGKYFTLVWETLNQAAKSPGFMQQIGQLWEDLPEPKSDTDSPPELRLLTQTIEVTRRQIGQPQQKLIRSNAGNWPIGHLHFRAETAAKRGQFNQAAISPETIVRYDRIQAQKGKQAKPITLFLRVAPLSQGDGFVLIKRPLFSKSQDPPRNAKEEKQHEVVTLRSIMEQDPQAAKQLSFGQHPQDRSIDADSFVVKAPALIEIRLTPATLRQLHGKQLLLPCELAGPNDPEAAIQLQSSSGDQPADSIQANVHWLIQPGGKAAQELTAAGELFCDVFPNRFFYVDDRRGLAAGFHLVEGFFRDDQPLMQKVLDPQQTKQLNQLWDELDFVTQSAETLLRGFVWFERSERHVLQDERFDFLRAEDPRLVQLEMLRRFEAVYLQKMNVKLIDDTLQPEKPSEQYDIIHGFFEQVRAGLAKRNRQLPIAEKHALEDVLALAARAYRRDLSPEESASLRSLYATLREQGQAPEAALRGMFTAVLMSPNFLYRYTEAPPGKGVASLSATAQASRLSYFLWSSLPDAELLAAARTGQLRQQRFLIAHTQRMLQSPRVDGFAREFLGQWLRYRDYLAKDPINADSFPGYTEPLREAMFEEPTRLATYLIRNDRPITDLLDSDITFVNGVLAKHYGGTIARQHAERSTDPEQWVKVDGLREAGRGGLFGMGVVLTKNSSGERTSPVKRGFWAVHHLLGKHFPPPPADVPELPPNERESKKTIRELIAAHTAHQKCAICHKHFDSFGMALEGFDPIGRLRTKDMAGRPIDNTATFPSGAAGEGVPGLIDYIERHRKDDFVRTFCRKFLGYALGRSVMLSDEPLLQKMAADLKQNEYRFSVLFETVVDSAQFRLQQRQEPGPPLP